MDKPEPGTMILCYPMSLTDASIYAVAPVDRDRLQRYIADARQRIFHGVQVPMTVTHMDPETGETREEHIPGCATCSV